MMESELKSSRDGSSSPLSSVNGDLQDFDLNDNSAEASNHSNSQPPDPSAKMKRRSQTQLLEEEASSCNLGPTVKRIKVTSIKKSPPPKKRRSKWDNPEEMLTNPKAPLAKCDLREILCSPAAWDILDEVEKQKVLNAFPGTGDIVNAGTKDAHPNITSLRNNDNFRHDVVRYQDDLSKGRHDPEWIRQAQVAHEQRAIGFYDEYLTKAFKEDWKMEIPELQHHEVDVATSGKLGEDTRLSLHKKSTEADPREMDEAEEGNERGEPSSEKLITDSEVNRDDIVTAEVSSAVEPSNTKTVNETAEKEECT